MLFKRQTLVHSQLLAHCTGREVHCVSCPRIHSLQSVGLQSVGQLLLPISRTKNGPHPRRRPLLQGFRNLPQNVSVLLNHEPGGSGGIISVVSFVDSSSSTSSPWSDSTSKDPNRWTPMAHYVMSLFLRPRNFQHFSLWAQILVVSH